MLNQDQTSTNLNDLLLSRNITADTLNNDGRPAEDPSDATLFRFDYTGDSGKNYGSVVILLGTDSMAMYFSDNMGKGFIDSDKKGWYDFLAQLKQFAVRHFMTFDVRNVNRMKFDIGGNKNLKEGLMESWSGTRNVSYDGNPSQARLMIKHSKPLGENDLRYRQIDKLFVETIDGERFMMPFKNLTGGRAMLQHVRQGGNPYDRRGQHICSIVEELNVLKRYTRASSNKTFEDDSSMKMAEDVKNYYESLKKTAKRIARPKGYSEYFESWEPLNITYGDVIVENLREMFAHQMVYEGLSKKVLDKVRGKRR
jgi:hypothetical protein